MTDFSPPEQPILPPTSPTYTPPPPGQGYAPPAQRGTNGLAIASLVLGIVWMCGIGSILAVIFGRMAKKQIAETGEQGAGLATAGFVLGVIGVSSIVLWILAIVAIQLLGQNASTSFSQTGNAINELVFAHR